MKDKLGVLSQVCPVCGAAVDTPCNTAVTHLARLMLPRWPQVPQDMQRSIEEYRDLITEGVGEDVDPIRAVAYPNEEIDNPNYIVVRARAILIHKLVQDGLLRRS